jgi:hypothetical protein
VSALAWFGQDAPGPNADAPGQQLFSALLLQNELPCPSPSLRDYAETIPTAEISRGTLFLDLESGNVFEVILTQHVASIDLSNPPSAGRAGLCSLIVKQDATGGRTLAWAGRSKMGGRSDRHNERCQYWLRATEA